MQDREPDEFRESTSLLQIWLLFRQNRVALLVSTYFYPDFGRSFPETHHAL